MSRGLDNRNPGNIRRSRVRCKGEVHPRPTRSSSSSAAQRGLPGAVFVVLHTYRVRHSLDTVAQMIARWAPPSENRTDLYVRFRGRGRAAWRRTRCSTRSTAAR